MRERDDRTAGGAAEEAEGRAELGAGEGEGVLTLVCLKCGTEYYYSEGGPPSEVTCDKCGNTVFRSFYSADGDEVAEDFEDSTSRDMHPDDAEGDTFPGDVLDLNRG